ncbi:hypothetical protein MT325_m142R [Paramecium bursaria chlorella virus MT325]|uniref:Uncharacterized protein m142R n=1 Tax=Paramecium bursaria Chlorella virus MT325 TaxID=346932 RepID=A7ITM2_PBCVM|nr:hypothetical protein MT325_m142R [Paramecium bursaria chlorella virus MT325]
MWHLSTYKFIEKVWGTCICCTAPPTASDIWKSEDACILKEPFLLCTGLGIVRYFENASDGTVLLHPRGRTGTELYMSK